VPANAPPAIKLCARVKYPARRINFFDFIRCVPLITE
jgi:hypothetical protein